MTNHFLKAALIGAVALTAVTGSAFALDRRVTIVNNTSYRIVQFYASHTDADTWEENIFGGDFLAPGYEVVVNIDDGSGYCMFDFKAVFDDGVEVDDYDINVCEVSTYTYNP